jgi:ATP-binding protein involved in chromosome partitioning
MPTPTENQVRTALAEVRDPETGLDVVEAGLIQGIQLRGGHVSFTVEVAPERGRNAEPLRKACEDRVARLPGALSVTAVLTAHSERRVGPAPPHTHAHGSAQGRAAPPPGARGAPSNQRAAGIPGVDAIIAVASGKGGVGKSTVAVNLALALSALGLKVGLLDADIYGPSLPRLMAIANRPEIEGKRIKPIEKSGIKTMSLGFLVDAEAPMIWRGPMVTGALTQLLMDVDWAPLDVLVVDMPPGTGDAQMTLAQRVPLAGAVIVSTPQDIALIDARKGLAMFRKTEVPILGIVENMSTFVCPHCGKESHIFGHGGARDTAAQLECDFLGEIPLVPSIRETSDAGTPIVALAPNSAEAGAFIAIAKRVAEKLSAGTSRPAPRIVIE